MAASRKVSIAARCGHIRCRKNWRCDKETGDSGAAGPAGEEGMVDFFIIKRCDKVQLFLNSDRGVIE